MSIHLVLFWSFGALVAKNYATKTPNHQISPKQINISLINRKF